MSRENDIVAAFTDLLVERVRKVTPPAPVVEQPRPILYRIPEAAAQLGISKSRVYELIADGTLPVTRILGKMRVPSDELRAFIAANVEQSIKREAGE